MGMVTTEEAYQNISALCIERGVMDRAVGYMLRSIRLTECGCMIALSLLTWGAVRYTAHSEKGPNEVSIFVNQIK